MPVIDGLLAATAMQFDLTVVSRDETFHKLLSLEVFDPWLP
jgi:predicted nucleic acid-binding protein